MNKNQSYLTNYYIQGQVLDKGFKNPVYARASETEEELIHNLTFQYAEGNWSCDCNKRIFIAAEEMEEEENPCGDTIPYQELFLVRPDGEKIDLLQEGYFVD